MIEFDFVMQLVDNIGLLRLKEEVNRLREAFKMDSVLPRTSYMMTLFLTEAAISMVSSSV